MKFFTYAFVIGAVEKVIRKNTATLISVASEINWIRYHGVSIIPFEDGCRVVRL
jgi:hypothetical protein